jgi:hypothetical protein
MRQLQQDIETGNLFFIQTLMPRLDNCGSKTRGIQSNNIVAVNLRKQIILGTESRAVVVVVLSAFVAAMRVVLVWHRSKSSEKLERNKGLFVAVISLRHRQTCTRNTLFSLSHLWTFPGTFAL